MASFGVLDEGQITVDGDRELQRPQHKRSVPCKESAATASKQDIATKIVVGKRGDGLVVQHG